MDNTARLARRQQLKNMIGNTIAMHAFAIARERYRIAHAEADLPVVSQTMNAMVDLLEEIHEYVPAGEA